MEIEKEVRYLVDENCWNKILNGTTEYKPKEHMIDITLGKYGFDSFAKTGRVFRVRQKGQRISLEIKKRVDNSQWLEESIPLESVEKGLSYLHLAGLDPYLYIDRYREVKKYKGLKIFFDNVDMLGRFIEIEYQDCANGLSELNEFVSQFDIKGEPQELYGDIIIHKYKTNPEFRAKFDIRMSELMSNATRQK